MKKNAIALLITLMFIIVITVAIGYGLKEVNKASSLVEKEKFLYQSSIIVEDVLNILKKSKDLKDAIENKSSEALYLFLSQSEFIPFKSGGLDVLLSIKSARAKFNPNTITAKNIDVIKEYMNNKQVNSEYVDLLIDSQNKIKDDGYYNTALFNTNPELFRDFIASKKHLQKINNFYAKEYNDNNLKNIDFNELFYYNSDNNTSIDLNYATAATWELITGAQPQRAEDLALGAGMYTTVADLNLDKGELEILSKFNTSFFEPILSVTIEIMQEKSSSKINFEYDMKKKKESNFVYEI
jgi:hypothetical protein